MTVVINIYAAKFSGVANKASLRFTLSNATLGSVIVSDPIGWDTNSLNLERDVELCGVLETYESNLTFYHDAALSYIVAAQALGFDAVVTMLAEITNDYGETYETYYSGLVDMESINELDLPTKYKIQSSTKQDDVWSAVQSRKSIAVDVKSTTDLDGNAVTPGATITITFSPQVIQKITRVDMLNFADPSYVDLVFNFTPVNRFGIIDLGNATKSELQTKYNLNTAESPALSAWLFEMTESGTFDIDASLTFADDPLSPTTGPTTVPGDFDVKIMYGYNVFTTVTFTRTDHGAFGVNQTSQFTLSLAGIFLPKGSKIYIYVETNAITTGEWIVAGGIRPLWESFIQVLGHTTFPQTTSDVMRTGVVADSIIKRISGDHFYSDFFGVGGCGYNLANCLGLHFKGYNFNQKPFAMSMADWIKNVNPIMNIGMGYEKVSGIYKIRVEEKAHFYDSSSNSINIPYVNGIQRSLKKGLIFNDIEIGNTKWQLSSGGSLIDDFQTKHGYAGPSKYTGGKFSQLTDWIAAALLLELTRRSSTMPGQTFDTDNNVCVIKIDGTVPDLASLATANILDPSGRYNKTLTPARAMYRWLNVLNIGVQEYLGRTFRFVNGDGNFLAEVQITSTACAGDVAGLVAENSDITITNDVLHGTEQIDFSHKLIWEDWKTIRDNKNLSIGISETGTDFVPYFIDKIQFYLFQELGKFTLFKAS